MEYQEMSRRGSSDDGATTVDLSYADLDVFPDFLLEKAEGVNKLNLEHNQISILPRSIASFHNLTALDISNNAMSYLSPEIVHLQRLESLIARNNRFDNDSIPKELGMMQHLRVVNFSGNRLTEFPIQLTELRQLQSVYLGANSISSLPKEVGNMHRLEVFYLGGNRLQEVAVEVGQLVHLVSLVLCDNQLTSLPSSLANLRNLQSLSLHSNQLSTMPREIVSLNLTELSLRNNPLIQKFVEDMTYKPPSLLELAGRVVKVKAIRYSPDSLPSTLIKYLDSACRCVNPKCKGVYFTSHVEHVKFVDFCGKYRLPLLEYLCSPRCTKSPCVVSSGESDSEDEHPASSKMKKVLLG